jgi:hypothetical protein
MDLQVFTPGYGKLKDLDEKLVGPIIKGLAEAKYAIFDKDGKQIIDPNRYTIRIDQISIMDERDGPWYGYKIIDNYGRTYHRTVSRGQIESFKARPEFWNFHVNYVLLEKTQPEHTGPLPDYLIDLIKGDYLAYHEKLMSAIMNNRGDASTVTNIGNEPTIFGRGGKRRRTIKRKSN